MEGSHLKMAFEEDAVAVGKEEGNRAGNETAAASTAKDPPARSGSSLYAHTWMRKSSQENKTQGQATRPPPPPLSKTGYVPSVRAGSRKEPSAWQEDIRPTGLEIDR
ncbi:hypothetical protein L249_8421, partial [Ophiocordyceps polyrhachis-furcata BCC 54312]